MTAPEVESWSSRLALPVTAVVLGVVSWIALAVGGDPRGGAVAFGILVLYALIVFLLARRSDVAKVLAGRAPDERYRALDMQAVAITGFVLILCVIGGFLWEEAHGRSGMPYTLLGAIAAFTYFGALVYGRLRG